jgi:site-specific DNA-methyltransferase (adenine-specific)
MIELMQGDCLERMKEIESGSVDMVLADPPYGTTACKWDSVIPLEPMWEQLKRVIKSNGAIVMTASQPFTTTLISSNLKMFKYCWVYEKTNAKGFQSCKYKPLAAHEDVAVFARGKTEYNPQMWECPPAHVNKRNSFTLREMGEVYGGGQKPRKQESTSKFPRSVIPVSNHTPRSGNTHPTQKPVPLMEYMIKTYTNEGETVLDFTMGSGTTGVACKNLNRHFIGIEMDEGYFEIARERISAVLDCLRECY